MFDVIFKYSQGKDLLIMDGAGELPLHKLVREHRHGSIRYIIEYKPELLWVESATGMTPIDIASTAYLQSVCEESPRLPYINRYSISDERASYFSSNMSPLCCDVDGENYENRSVQYITLATLQKLLKKYPGKRRLVSLMDANEVAKRLALQQQKEQKFKDFAGDRKQFHTESDDGNVDGTQDDDEVTEWKDKARGFPQADREKWMKEVVPRYSEDEQNID